MLQGFSHAGIAALAPCRLHIVAGRPRDHGGECAQLFRPADTRWHVAVSPASWRARQLPCAAARHTRVWCAAAGKCCHSTSARHMSFSQSLTARAATCKLPHRASSRAVRFHVVEVLTLRQRRQTHASYSQRRLLVLVCWPIHRAANVRRRAMTPTHCRAVYSTVSYHESAAACRTLVARLCLRDS